MAQLYQFFQLFEQYDGNGDFTNDKILDATYPNDGLYVE